MHACERDNSKSFFLKQKGNWLWKKTKESERKWRLRKWVQEEGDRENKRRDEKRMKETLDEGKKSKEVKFFQNTEEAKKEKKTKLFNILWKTKKKRRAFQKEQNYVLSECKDYLKKKRIFKRG